jgi:hypothetical protein
MSHSAGKTRKSGSSANNVACESRFSLIPLLKSENRETLLNNLLLVQSTKFPAAFNPRLLTLFWVANFWFAPNSQTKSPEFSKT